MPESWRSVLAPVFIQRRYPGSFWRVLEALMDIQRGRHDVVYAGAYGISKATGMERKRVREVLRRLVADDVLEVAEWGAPGRYSGEEKHGAPGKAHGYRLGPAAAGGDAEEWGHVGPLSGPILSRAERGHVGPHTLERKGARRPPIERGHVGPPISSGVSYDPPSSEKDAQRARRAPAPDPAAAPLTMGLQLRDLTSRHAGEDGSADMDAELRSRISTRRRRTTHA